MSIELTVTLKDEERTYKQEFLVYDAIAMSEEDPMVKECLAKAKANFKGEPEDIIIKTTMVLR